jgi:hypothetical protein
MRGARFKELVETTQEAVLAPALDEGKCGPDGRIVVLGLGGTLVEKNCNPFD